MQQSLDFEEKILSQKIQQWEKSHGNESSQVYTSRKTIDFMLEIMGINSSVDINNVKILEPSCGEGYFTSAIIEKILNNRKNKVKYTDLLGRIVATDIVESSVEKAKVDARSILIEHSYTSTESDEIVNDWFKVSDYLLEHDHDSYTHIVGNPPYVSVEKIPKSLLSEYRSKYSTMTDRADLYIAFFEKALNSLGEGGILQFICTDRWTKNIYGRNLRNMISQGFSLDLYIDLYGIKAFEKDVLTYPAITHISKRKYSGTIILHGVDFCLNIANEVRNNIINKSTSLEKRKDILSGGSPWLTGSSDEVSIVKSIESKFPKIEDAGCKVQIGTATGANSIFIIDKSIDIEKERRLPVISAAELKKGRISWKEKYIINTYDDLGLINLDEFPKLKSYLLKHKDTLSNRHIAKKNPSAWYKTIDRVYPKRSREEKLLIPDISNNPIALYDKGFFNPNNSIYYITSIDWDLHALKVVILSNLTKVFISTYSTKIANGYLRFQAQHLRKLRLPLWSDIDDNLKNKLIHAGQSNNISEYSKLTHELYDLTNSQREILGS